MNRIGTSLLTIALLVTLTATAFAVPTAIMQTKAASPRDVVADTTDIYNKQSTGLPNVGVGEWVYLVGSSTDTLDVTAWAWELTARPNGSAAALSANDAPIVKFAPDVVGTFRVSLRVTTGNGQSEAVTMAINSSNYVGVGGITGEPTRGQCAMCHDEQTADWNETMHSTAFARKYSGSDGTGFRSTCVSCHVVGYNVDQGAANNGFDDRAREEGWVFVDSAHGGLIPGAWDSMKVNFPATANMGNIQCEACHGPGGNHNANTADNKIASTFDAGVCAKCHDSGTHHFRPMQWRSSLHANAVEENRAGCADCHNGAGFIDQLAGVVDSLSRWQEYVPITCVTCHDPHDATNTKQVRTQAPYTLINGVQVDFEVGNLCVNCHHARTVADTAIVRSVTSRFGPHYGAQGDMLAGTNAFTFGQAPVRNYHAMSVENGCVGCHMAETPEVAADTAKFLKLGDHTFSMKTAAGAEHVEACADCHGEIESFDAMMADSDWDGDGATEGIKDEIAGLMTNLAMALPPYGEPTVTLNNDLSPVQRRAAWNWRFVTQDASGGMHNAAYTKQILTAALGQDLGVAKIGDAVPTNFSLSSPYPNPFNPISSFSYTLAKDVNVSIKVFDMAGREVATLVSGSQKAGEYKAPINMMGKASGIYLLKMEAGSFTASQKLALVK